MKPEKKKVLKLGMTEQTLNRLVAAHEKLGTRTLAEALVGLLDAYEGGTD